MVSVWITPTQFELITQSPFMGQAAVLQFDRHCDGTQRQRHNACATVCGLERSAETSQGLLSVAYIIIY